MIYKTRGIVFRTVKYSETSVICKIYTDRFGMQSYIINGVRAAKAKTKAALLQVMNVLEMEVYHHENRNLHRIKELRQFYSFRSVFFNPLKSAVGLFMMEVLNKCIREHEPNEHMFSFITQKLIALDENEHTPNDFLIRFLLELTGLMGFSPHRNLSETTPVFDLRDGIFTSGETPHSNVLTAPHSALLSSIITDEEIILTAMERKKLLESLLEYFQLHVPDFSRLKSLAVLSEVFK